MQFGEESFAQCWTFHEELSLYSTKLCCVELEHLLSSSLLDNNYCHSICWEAISVALFPAGMQCKGVKSLFSLGMTSVSKRGEFPDIHPRIWKYRTLALHCLCIAHWVTDKTHQFVISFTTDNASPRVHPLEHFWSNALLWTRLERWVLLTTEISRLMMINVIMAHLKHRRSKRLSSIAQASVNLTWREKRHRLEASWRYTRQAWMHEWSLARSQGGFCDPPPLYYKGLQLTLL